MKIPKRMAQPEEEIVRALRVFPPDRFEERGPVLRENGERAETPLRMIQRARAAEPPEFCRQDEPLHRIAVRPPAVPKVPDVAARLVVICGQIGRGQKPGDAEEDRFDVVIIFAEQRQRQPLRQEGEGEFVLFVAERRGDFLEERGIAAVTLDDVFDPRRFALEPELLGRCENALEPILRQVFQRRLATAGASERDVRGEFIGEHRRIDADLRHVPVRFCG